MTGSLKDTYTLSNGVTIPKVGFGTWQMEQGPATVNAVRTAIEVGYRHIDTAAAYQNEKSVAEGIKQSGLKRDELFLTTKLANPDHGYEATRAAFHRSLENLEVSYLDLYLIHWPNPIAFRENWVVALQDSWRAMQEFYEQGLIRSIGVSNCRQHHLEAILQTSRIKPQVNQIRLCPGDVDQETVDFSRSQDILLEAYSPLGTGLVFEVPQLKEIAQAKQRTVAQVALRWNLQKGFLPLPKSLTPKRIKENSQLFDFELSQADIEKIDALSGCCGKAVDPDTAGF